MKITKVSRAGKKNGADKTIQQNLPVKTENANSIENSAKHTNGLNEDKTIENNLLPSDGSNLTNL